MYELADARGIMLSHEFPLSYSPYPFTEPVFLAKLDQTIRSIVKQYRNHPCIVEWSGGNEMQRVQGQQHPVLLTIEQAALAEDDRMFRATCAMQGSRHSP
ncbi:MAG: hypothetical protein M1608_08945 [Candidatus Omnitrophica bacterium]|nr:hypothetical protein [Candidatus Omnitrophota bacterium]